MGNGKSTSRKLDVLKGAQERKREVISYNLSPKEEQAWQHRRREDMGRRLAEALDRGLRDKRSLMSKAATDIARGLKEARKAKKDVNFKKISDKEAYGKPVEESFRKQNKAREEQNELSPEDPNYRKEMSKRERFIAEENERLRAMVLNLIFTSPVFKEKYIEWKADYESKKSDPKFVELYPTIDHYVFRKGQEFINERRDEVIKGRIGSMPHIKDMEGDEELKEKERLAKVTAAYVNEFYDDLLVYSSLKDDDPTKLRMLDALRKGLNIKNVKDEALLRLLTGIAGDVYAAEAAKVNFVAAHKEMVEIVEYAIAYKDGEIDEEEWGIRIIGAIQDNAKEVLEERCALGEASLHIGGFDSIGSEQSFGSPTAVAHYAGVNIVGKVGEDEYVVRFPGSSYQTRMRIEQVNGQDGKWIVSALDRFRDPSKNPWVRLDIGQVRYGFNKMFLDFQMDSMRYRRIGKESPNEVVKDKYMMDITTHLYGWDKTRMNSNVVTTPERRNLFTNMMVVLLKEDRGKDHGNLGSLVARVRKLDLVLKNPEYAVQIRQLVTHPGGRTWTLSTLLDAIYYPKKTGAGRGSIPI